MSQHFPYKQFLCWKAFVHPKSDILIMKKLGTETHADTGSRQCTYKHNIQGYLHNQLPCKNKKYYIFRVCVCSLIYPARKAYVSYYIVICGLSGPTIFLTDYLKNIIIFGKDLLNIKCVFWSSLHFLSETFLILRRIQWDIIKMYICLNVKYQLYLSDFKQHQIFLSYFRKRLKYQISWKSVQWEPSCSIRTDRHTMKLTVAFCNSVNMPKK